MKYRVPTADVEYLFHPPREEASQLIGSNHSLLESCDFKISDVSFRDLRSAARNRIAETAGRGVSEGLRIVVGAHQPGFHGPGILYKHRVLQELSQDNLSVNFVVDSDVCEGVSVRMPCRRGRGVGLKEVTAFPSLGPIVFEELPVPPKREVDARYDEIEKLLESLEAEEMLSSFRDFLAVHERVYREGDSAAKTLTRYRQGYYPTPHVMDNSISTISESAEFLAYACDIIRKIENFHVAYNSSLSEHRHLHRIRNPVNPFPDLKREGNLWELPFWGVDANGARHKLSACGEGAEQRILTDKGARDGLPVEREALASLRIRPRAVCLTLFLRLFVADLFVHGVGGGNYDRVTDRIIQAHYGASAPAYVVCSRTKFPPSDRTVALERRAAELRQRLRQMEHNPEKFATNGDPLAEEALRILLSESGPKPSAEQHSRLRDTRRTLLKRIKPKMELVRNELAEVEDVLRREAALHRRDFPYFLYPRSEL